MFAANAAMAEKSGAKLNSEANALLEKFAPGPITVIAPGNKKYPTIGIRIPAHEFILALLEKYGRATLITEALLLGQLPLTQLLLMTKRSGKSGCFSLVPEMLHLKN